MYYPVWRPSSRRKKPTPFTTTSSRVHVSMASPVSSIRPIWERPKVSPGWPRIAVHRSRCRPQRSTSGCPARYGLRPRSRVSLRCSTRYGPSRVPGLHRRIICCWPLFRSEGQHRFGLPGALWLAAEKSGVFALLHSLWPKPRSGPSPAHYLLLAAIHRICQPGPKTEVADWYRDSILSSLWGFAPERFTSQAFWDCFDAIATGESLSPGQRDELEEAQLRLLGLWKEKQLVTRRLLAYDTTNFYTYIASNNDRNRS